MADGSSGKLYIVNPDALTSTGSYTASQAAEINSAVNWIIGMANEVDSVAWTGPAADSFKAAAGALKKANDSVQAVLNQCVNKMNATVQNYLTAEETNRRILVVVTTGGGGNTKTTTGGANTTTKTTTGASTNATTGGANTTTKTTTGA